jgi:hypothetical protein
LSIQAILRRIAAGEEQAFAELVDLYQLPLFGFLGRMGMGPGPGGRYSPREFPARLDAFGPL